MKTLSVLGRGTLGVLGNGIRQSGPAHTARHSFLAKGRTSAVYLLRKGDCASRQFSTTCPRSARKFDSRKEFWWPLDLGEYLLSPEELAARRDPIGATNAKEAEEDDQGAPDRSSFAFAFDIDGVLLHQSDPLPGAIETLKFLHENKIPFILLTNGGGKHERDRVSELSEKLQVPLSMDNFVQSHTPFNDMQHLKRKNILVTGSDAAKAREIAWSYGFDKVIIPADILMADPSIWPFDPLLESVYASTARPLHKPIYKGNPYSETWDPKMLKKNLRIHGILVFNDPRDWALDLQIITDLLLSHQGVLGTYSNINGLNGVWQQDGQPEICFSNSDLLWASKHPMPRLGQGAFQAAVGGVFKAIKDQLGTKGPRQELSRASLVATRLGKPMIGTYKFAERVLMEHRARLLGPRQAESRPLKSVYMIGDNPDSDIAGAKNYTYHQKKTGKAGATWFGVLVETGVFKSLVKAPMRHKPAIIVKDVFRAVRWALVREKWQGPFPTWAGAEPELPRVRKRRTKQEAEEAENPIQNDRENVAKEELPEGDENVVERKLVDDVKKVVEEGEATKEGK
ncbi:hypothetical protein MCOR25_003534 [Pyricularia grisea]|nr:hypothetical protein MCOR25_003534 [Pyricularia grisea]